MSIGKPMPSFSPEPGWLMRECYAAHIECMADHNPGFFKFSPAKFTVPINEKEAADVFARMDARFKAWTGKSLADHISQQQTPDHKPEPSFMEPGQVSSMLARRAKGDWD